MKTNINSIQRGSLDQVKLESYKKYFTDNFNSHFKKDLGTEQILDILSKLDRIENWIDIGGGTSTLFWSIPIKSVEHIYYNDIYIEPFYILSEKVLQTDKLPKCYTDVCHIYGTKIEDLTFRKSQIKDAYIFDSLNEWSIDRLSFDLITQFGTFGLSPNASDYINCIEYSYLNLRRGGHLVGANWTLNDEYSKKRGINNSYLSEELITKFSKKSGCKVLENNSYIIDDGYYLSVLVWHIVKT